jgi:hypothetical protein
MTFGLTYLSILAKLNQVNAGVLISSSYVDPVGFIRGGKVQQTTPGTSGSVGMDGGWWLSKTTAAAAAVAGGEGLFLFYLEEPIGYPAQPRLIRLSVCPSVHPYMPAD